MIIMFCKKLRLIINGTQKYPHRLPRPMVSWNGPSPLVWNGPSPLVWNGPPLLVWNGPPPLVWNGPPPPVWVFPWR